MSDNNFQEIMKKAQEMQNKMKWMQQKLLSKEIIGESGGGIVKITVNGKHEVLKVMIDAQLYVPGQKHILEDLIAGAMNDAIRKVDKILQEEMKKLAADLGLPSGREGDSGESGGSLQ
jgi:nucleoid-associated protein EbfC